MTQSDPQIVDASTTARAGRTSLEASAPLPAEGQNKPADELLEDDLLVEDVSIDGMCGVY